MISYFRVLICNTYYITFANVCYLSSGRLYQSTVFLAVSGISK